MKSKRRIAWLIILLSAFQLATSLRPISAALPVKSSDQSDVRSAVQNVFDQLKAGQFEALYDGLPSTSRGRIQRERFVNGLQKTRNLYQLERIEIGAVRVAKDLAVVDTVMYARIAPPFNAEGKLVVQQYLVREDGRWKVATGDNATIDRFLRSNPSFARRFPIKRPLAFLKQDGKWVEFNPRPTANKPK